MSRALKDEINRGIRVSRDALFKASLPAALVTIAAMDGRCWKEYRGDTTDHCILVVFLSDVSEGSLNTGRGISVFEDDPQTANCALVVDGERRVRFAINPSRRIEDRYWVGSGVHTSKYVKVYDRGTLIPDEWKVYRVWYSDDMVEVQ